MSEAVPTPRHRRLLAAAEGDSLQAAPAAEMAR